MFCLRGRVRMRAQLLARGCLLACMCLHAVQWSVHMAMRAGRAGCAQTLEPVLTWASGYLARHLHPQASDAQAKQVAAALTAALAAELQVRARVCMCARACVPAAAAAASLLCGRACVRVCVHVCLRELNRSDNRPSIRQCRAGIASLSSLLALQA